MTFSNFIELVPNLEIGETAVYWNFKIQRFNADTIKVCWRDKLVYICHGLSETQTVLKAIYQFYNIEYNRR